jgi:solute carrier family 50 protein (sugar transporter)
MTDVSFILGVLGNVISILLFISPLKTFWRIVKNKSTEDFKSLPYICTLLSTSLWTYYGLIKPGGLLIFTVNGVGAALETVYVILFIIYAPKKSKIKTVSLVLLVDIVFFVVVFLVSFLLLNQHTRITVIGVLCVCLTLSMYGSPLVVTRTVIVTKSVEFLPFLLSFFLFLNGGVWTVWAVFNGDVFVGIPNGIGFGLGAAQLLLFVIYRKERPRREGIQEEDVKSNGLRLVAEDIELGGGDELCSADHIGDSKSHPNNLQRESSLP